MCRWCERVLLGPKATAAILIAQEKERRVERVDRILRRRARERFKAQQKEAKRRLREEQRERMVSALEALATGTQRLAGDAEYRTSRGYGRYR